MNSAEEALARLSTAKNYNHWIFEKIRPFLGKKILEVGCGLGSFSKLLLNAGGSVTALDINPQYLKKLALKIKSRRLRIIRADIEQPGSILSREEFSSIVCLNVLEHLQADQLALNFFYHLLEKDGYLLLLVPAHPWLFGSLDRSFGHFRRYRKKGVIFMLKEAGFKIEKISFFNFFGLFGWLINSVILRRRSLSHKQLKFFDRFCQQFWILEEKINLPAGLSLLVVTRK